MYGRQILNFAIAKMAEKTANQNNSSTTSTTTNGRTATSHQTSSNGHENGHRNSTGSGRTSSRNGYSDSGSSAASSPAKSNHDMTSSSYNSTTSNNSSRTNGFSVNGGSGSRRVSNGSTTSTHSTPETRQKNGSNGNAGSQVYFDLKQPLPKLPVPDLESTLEKYLTLLKTVMSPGEYAQTKRVVDEFSKPDGDGPKLQGYLLRRQEERDNWANEYWLYDMYLNIRLPLIINSNPAAVFRRMTFFNSEDQIKFAARFVLGMMDFKRLADTQSLPVDRCSQRENCRPMCMYQHPRLLASTRLPGRVLDTQYNNTKDIGNDFIVVACRNQYFRINVEHDGRCVSESSLISQMTHAMTLAKMTSNRQPQVGLLTTQSRDVWAHQRKYLLEDSTNRSILADLENSVCLVCFDEGGLGKDMTSRTHHVIHGGGSLKNTGNRWMDKSIQVIVSEDGTCGINMEHSMAEGIALGHIIEHVFTFMAKEPSEGSEAPSRRDSTAILPTPLVWNLSPQTLSDIHQAAEQVDIMIDDFDVSVVHFKDFGREFIKSQQTSPDAFIQLALQLTYYKIHENLSSTYESASVRRFRHGRVDVIRANSPPALNWIKAMLGLTETTEEAKLQLFKTAVAWQQEYTQNTILGHGVDLHLVGLREAAVDLAMPVPSLFDDLGYKEFNNFKLSTSQVMTKSDYWMAYGAVVPDGYGCCYNPKANSIIFSVASLLSSDETSSDMFIGSLESSLNQMAELCQNASTSAGSALDNGRSRGE